MFWGAGSGQLGQKGKLEVGLGFHLELSMPCVCVG